MKEFKNVREIKTFCKENKILFANNDRKDALLDKIRVWERIQLVKEEKVKVKIDVFTAYEFGQMYKLERSMIRYLVKSFGDKKDSYNNWLQICKDKKVID